ncbi:MAG: hypothetical protein HKN21_03005 [Candidatus Eisenbacteria bacterium]|uniref:Uncharacterized protein n=1 Tax=Eiseniibacteriota bacterium TaxID=2212470 RepID=A0A7Y2E9E2_UNCEI|nr:hypothetical protein [Candidatus Eisenbacteria bacterium]
MLAIPVVLVGIAVATASQISSSPEVPLVSDSNSGATPVGTSAMKAYIDPETGVLSVSSQGGTLELDEETKERLRRDDEGLIEVTHPDGSVSIDLQGRFSNAATLHLTENGKEFSCANHEGQVCNSLHSQNESAKKLEVQ